MHELITCSEVVYRLPAVHSAIRASRFSSSSAPSGTRHGFVLWYSMMLFESADSDPIDPDPCCVRCTSPRSRSTALYFVYIGPVRSRPPTSSASVSASAPLSRSWSFL